jgi:hypothetical protein
MMYLARFKNRQDSDAREIAVMASILRMES